MDTSPATCPDCGAQDLERSTCRTVQGGEVETYLCPCGHEDAVTSRVWRAARCVGCDEPRFLDEDRLCRRCAESCVHCGARNAPHEDEDGRVCNACADSRGLCGEDGVCPRCWRVARWHAPIPRPTCRHEGCRETVAGPHEDRCQEHARRAA